MTWYAKKTSGGQAVIIDEADGRNVAVCYDDKDGDLVASTPELLSALRALESCPFDNPDMLNRALYDARNAIINAEGGK